MRAGPVPVRISTMHTLDADSFPPLPLRASLADAPWLVLKFGGTSVSTAQRTGPPFTTCSTERMAAGYRPLVVHSALAGVSNRIQDALQQALSGEFREQLGAIATDAPGPGRGPRAGRAGAGRRDTSPNSSSSSPAFTWSGGEPARACQGHGYGRTDGDRAWARRTCGHAGLRGDLAGRTRRAA